MTHDPFHFRPVSAVPDWARGLHMDEYRAFVVAIEKELRSRCCPFEDQGGVLQVHLPTGIARCGLYNIALRCAAARKDEYPGLVRAHFDRLFGPKPTKVSDEEFSQSYEEFRPHMKVRIYTDAYLRQARQPGASELVQRKLATDLNATVVCDLPFGAVTLERRFAKMWGIPEDEIVATAIANVAEDTVTKEPLPLLDGIEGFALLGQSYYVSSQIYHLAEYLPPKNAFGAIVAFPHRHILDCYPIDGDPKKVMLALRELTGMVSYAYREFLKEKGDVAMSPNLYWWRSGTLLHIPAHFDDKLGAIVAPPQEFIDYVLEGAAQVTGLPARG